MADEIHAEDFEELTAAGQRDQGEQVPGMSASPTWANSANTIPPEADHPANATAIGLTTTMPPTVRFFCGGMPDAAVTERRWA